jgi:hypothetical protein
MAGTVRHLLLRNGRFYARCFSSTSTAVARMQAIIGRAREEGKVGKPPSLGRFRGRLLCQLVGGLRL